MNKNIIYCCGLFIWSLLFTAHLKANPCQNLFEEEFYSKNTFSKSVLVNRRALQELPHNIITKKAFHKYQHFLSKHSSLNRFLPPTLVYEILADHEMYLFQNTLSKILLQPLLEKAKDTKDFLNIFDRLLKKELYGNVPQNTIPSRLKEYKNGNLYQFRRALGYLSLYEINLVLHGGDLYSPTTESLLGRYLNETSSSTVVRSFPKKVSRSESALKFGDKKLVVALSRETYPIYKKYFEKIHFFIHYHTPEQGTLHIVFNGKIGSYAQLNNDISPERLQVGTLLPHIALKSTEAQRLKQYFDLGRLNNPSALYPWLLPMADGNTNDSDKNIARYCAASGYTSCTFWVGNIPIGDKLVNSYVFPGKVDSYADNELAVGRKAQIKELIPHHSKNKLAQKVWKAPGNEQLASVLGLEKENIKGEFANPGWVLISLIGAAKNDRVPVVFLVVEDHTQPLAENFDLRENGY